MSGYPPGPSDGNGLDNLFAQLRQQQSKTVNLEPSYSYYNNNSSSSNSNYFGSQSQQPPHGYQQPSVSSALPTPPSHGSQPLHSSAIMSPVDLPQPRIPAATGGASNADRTSSLLNLLKFSQPPGGPPTQPAPIGTPLPASREPSVSFPGTESQGGPSGTHGRGGSDLLAALMGTKATQQQASPQLAAHTQPQSTFSTRAASPPDATQAYLLQLLNQPKPSQSDSTPQLKATKIFTPPSQPSSQDDISGDLSQALEATRLDMNLMGSSATEAIPAFGNQNAQESTPKNLFTYVNPFEQLAASSPRNRTPKNATPISAAASAPAIQILKHPRHESPESKRKTDASSISSPAHAKRKLDPSSQASSAPPTPLPDGRTQLEALIGIGATGSNKETVHDALSEVGDQVNKQAQEAIARAEREENTASIEKDLRDMLAAKTEKEFETTAQVAAKSIKDELEKEENSQALDSLPTPIAEAVKEIIDDTAQGHIADSWESADAEDSPIKEEDEAVKVYNFPMRPWTSITIKETEEIRPTFRDEAIMDIARLKKDFDQIDRTLVTASNNFIVYGMSKNGGVRIIRQDDGKDARLFTETRDRIFSVVTSSSLTDMKESIIGTGISGTVYWALVKDREGDHIEDSNPEMYGFALPSLQANDSETPGGVLKTRARKSSAHPDFFAVGRGKYINIIWPSVIMKQPYLKNGKERIVDTDKYLSQHSLKVNTGKAGKDFTFSEDDSTIVSLDKAGRVKFWDVRSLTKIDSNGKPAYTSQIEIKEPVVTLTTTPASEKSWPTSVLFVDKLRPYQRGGALRYLIVGMKQNHTLQLWDLALAKPVQEIHLPHTKESDAVCSVLYHAATGMIVVGHPTRNSIYFLHLSAPKYNLPKSISQAEYMEKLVSNDATLPKPESTAVISGMREYSFANKGNLRSLDILQTPNASAAVDGAPTMFELYAMHSKGVTCISIKQSALGWSPDNKVIDAVNADKAGAITIDTLKEIPAPPVPEVVESSQLSVPTRIVPRPTSKDTGSKESPKKAPFAEPSASSSKTEDKADKKDNTLLNGGLTNTGAPEKSEKKKRRKATTSSENVVSGPSGTQNTPASRNIAHGGKTVILDPMSNTRNGSGSKSSASASSEASGPSALSQQDFSEGSLKAIENRISSEVKKHISDSLASLYQNINEDRRTQTAVADAKQDAMLRLVSATLDENVEATLGRIVSKTITTSVVPAITDVSSKAVNEQLGSKLNSQLSHSLPKELQKIIPDAIGKALQQPQLLKLMSETLAKSVAFRVEERFAVILQDVVTPAFSTLAVQASQRVAADIQRQASDQIDAIERQCHADSIKIEQLTQLVTGLTETVSSMAAAQGEFQGQFLRMQQQAAMDRRQASRQSEGHGARPSVSRPSTALTGPIEKTPAEIEFDQMLGSITNAMNSGEYENAVIQWLQTRREQEFFQKYFAGFNPEFIRGLTPLLLLSLGATISLDFEDDFLEQRVAWLETILASFYGHVSANDLEDQVRDLIPKIMGIYVQRLEHLFMSVSQRYAQQPILKRISLMVTTANRILESHREPGRRM